MGLQGSKFWFVLKGVRFISCIHKAVIEHLHKAVIQPQPTSGHRAPTQSGHRALALSGAEWVAEMVAIITLTHYLPNPHASAPLLDCLEYQVCVTNQAVPEATQGWR